MRRWGRVLIGLCLLVLVLVGTAGGLAFWLVRTESGANWVVERIERRAGTLFAVDSVSGSFQDGITASGIRLATDTATISIDRLAIAISLSDLIAGNLVLEAVVAGNVRFDQLESTDPGQAVAQADDGFSLPVDIELRRVTIDSLRIVTTDLDLPIGPTAFTAEIADGAVRVAGLSTSTNGVSIELDSELRLAAELDGTATFAWSADIDGDRWSGAGRVDGTIRALSFEHQLQTPFAVSSEGSLTFSDSPRAVVTLAWDDLTWPVMDFEQSSSGVLQLDGWLEQVSFETSGRLAVEEVPVGFAASGAATPDMISFEDLTLETALGDGRFSGSVLPRTLSWDLDFEAQGVDPGDLFPDWPGELSAAGRIEGTLDPDLRWSADGLTVSGTIRGQPLEATGRVESGATGDWLLDDVELDWAGNRASVDGEIGELLSLAIDVRAPRIAALTQRFRGDVTIQGELGGSLAAPSLEGSAVAEALSIDGYSLDRVEIRGRVAAVEDAEIEISFDAEGLRGDSVIANSIVGRVEGTTGSHAIAIDIVPDIGSGSIRGSGGWSGDRWEGDIDSIVLSQDLVGTWSLEEPGTVMASRNSLTLEQSCLQRDEARLCLGVDLGPDTNRLQATLESFDIASLRILTGDQVSLSGLYDAELDLQGPFDRPRGTLGIRGRSTFISIADVEAPLDVRLNNVEFNAVLTETELETSARISAAADASLEVDAVVSEIWTSEPEIRATAGARTNDVGFLSILSPEVGDVSGVATASVVVAGPIRSPDVRGQARWTDGRIEVPRWGLLLRDVDVSVTSPAGNELVYELTGMAGEGRVELTGRTQLDAEADWPTTFNLRGENLAAIELPEAQIVVSPDLDVVTEWPTIFVTGVVAIPYARLSLDELPAQSVTTSSDVVIHGVEVVAPQRPLDVQADLQLELGEDVSFSGSGLDAALSGGLAVEYRSGLGGIATGTLALAGTYATFGQILQLDDGRLVFSGPVTDPGLDVRGVRRFETASGEVLVGVTVTGSVRQPVTRLYSEPSMSDGDIVSYLVIGRPLSDSSRENSQALQTAALTLGLAQALPQIQHFGEAIGLDELSIRTSEANTGELMAGKQISPRVYMRYTYGLIDRIGGLLLRFELSEHLRLETRAGGNKAMDLLYTIERE